MIRTLHRTQKRLLKKSLLRKKISFFPKRHRLSAPPVTGFPGSRIIASRRAAWRISSRGRKLVTAFPSPVTVISFETPIPGSPVLACYFASLPVRSTARSALGSTAATFSRYGCFLTLYPLLLPEPV